MTTKKEIEVTLEREKETKNTVRYKELGTSPKVGVIYFPKATLDALGNPELLQVKVYVK